MKASDAATREALAYLHEAGRADRLERKRGAAIMVYGIVVVAAALGTPYLLAATKGSWWHGVEDLAVVTSGLASALPALGAAILALAARNAAWHGPVGLDLPTAFWALPQPLARRRLLLPRLATASAAAGLIGAAVGAAGGFVLGTLPGSSVPSATGAGGWAGATLGVGCTLVGVAIERHDRAVLRLGHRVFVSGWAAVTALVALALWALTAGAPNWLGHVLLWSGPWGWAVQPLVAVVSGSASLWPLAALAQVTLLAVGLRWCVREVPAIAGDALRRRARVTTEVTASLFSLELRQAKLTIQSPHRRGKRARLRLPAPRQPWQLMPWRDGTCLLRAPGRLAWAVMGLAGSAAATATAVAGPMEIQRHVLLSVLALCALYVCAAQLVEPARIDCDNPRRAANLPYSRGSLTLWHAALPVTGVLAGLAVAATVSWLFGTWHPGWAVLLLCVPTMVGAALVSAYRGSMPAHVAIGVETPFGNTAPLQMMAWYLRGPLGALLLTVPVLVLVLHHGGLGPGWFTWLVLVGAAQLLWAWRTGRRLA